MTEELIDKRSARANNGLLWLAALAATTLVMRGPIMAVGPLGSEVSEYFNLSSIEYGLLTSLPVFCLGVVSWGAPRLVSAADLKGAALITTALVAAGGFLRAADSASAFFFGTVLIGSGIALLNVVVPSIIKEQGGSRTGFILGCYASFIGLSGAVGSMGAIPAHQAFGSLSAAFAVWGAAAAAACASWIPVRVASIKGRRSSSSGGFGEPLSARLAKPLLWWMMLVMGIQSLDVYAVAAWLPQYLQDFGYDAMQAGFILFVFLTAGIPSGAAVGWWFSKAGSEVWIAVVLSLGYFASASAWILAPQHALAASAAAGFFQGGMLGAALIFFSRKSRNSAEMVWTSTFGQGLGYALGACGPAVVGFLKDCSGGWQAPLWFIAGTTLAWGFFGVLCARTKSL